ncbi:hypothetical protein [Marinilabilia salmonicolor]|uniref:Uncharacterized protein n=1 Tax=Marinilabilia salmonicolor TaxID=989 RepID=A0A368VG65_9BACT|nr:hypothetical protein [Marinilabilia salmonicolor]RCW38664.1 hypothetical protein DFO77_103134 [Marinilabilia salmonicolor]
MISINKYIRSILIQDMGVQSLVGDKIYSIIIPENVDNPVILIERLNNSRKYVKNNKASDEINIVIYSVANDYINSIEIAEKIDALLDCYELDNDEFKMIIRQNNIAEAYSGDYIQRLEYKITINYK